MPISNLAEQLAHAARDLNSSEVEETLEQAVSLAMELIDGCDGAGVTLARRGHALESPAYTADFVARGDALQYELQEGPCIDAVWDHEIVISTDLAKEARWTGWGPRVVEELGVRSLMCIQLFVEDEVLGALNIYSMRQSGAFTQREDRYVAQNLATHISLALFAAQQVEHLNLTVIRRDLIGQAEGILMERYDITAKGAFEVLKLVSSGSKVSLFSVAEEIVITRRIPTGAVATPLTAAPSALSSVDLGVDEFPADSAAM
jgi:GAF domain-containing protein